ncbi:hypothetical protein L228DRAFT_246763 [Xylona heveae TC161]|uniref:RING-CH-type domain-containing protein n=1 Tax=Xylona heveae (strain CBS 132557 / TC161) TaxID=1328760 RepID=A0A165GQJ3_XYLHT|nr:hypothetical protein L228DRAFT_246763 [Xylona heveae TC161]KZF22471.1 hypothetical protein L228DRAFT_246763 [Xylona heveae TC161]
MNSAPPRTSGPQPRLCAQSSADASDDLSRDPTIVHRTPADPEAVYINKPVEGNQEAQRGRESPAENAEEVPARIPSEEDEPRKCWICFSDETEDTPLTSEWRTPCPCALTAHESCLLDWIADLEAPNPNRRTAVPAKILCPQCKSEIKVARPRSIIVESVNAVERILGKAVVPGAFTVIAGSIWAGCLVHGIATVHLIFGREGATRILTYGLVPQADPLTELFAQHSAIVPRWNLPLSLGLPLIPVALIFSRTSVADSVLPLVPITFFIAQNNDWDRWDLTRWPPSPAMVIATLPYLRVAYNELYERVFGARERRWIKEIQPRSGETEQDINGGDIHQAPENDAQRQDEQNLLMEINVEVEVVDDDEGVNNDLPPGQQEAAQGPAAAGDQAAEPHGRHNNFVISTSQLVDTILGALVFPGVSAAMGYILQLTLPRSWTTPPFSGPFGRTRLTGLLQARWGRSIVGGCIFVVLKDALTLYCRWKLAQGHRKRQVVDYDRKKKKTESR